MRSELSLHWDAFKTWELVIGGALAELKSEPDTKVQKTHGQRDGSEYLGAKFHILYLQLSGVCQSRRNTSLERNCAQEQDVKERATTQTYRHKVLSFQNSALLCNLGVFPVAIERSEAILSLNSFCVLEHFISFFFVQKPVENSFFQYFKIS